LIFGPTVLKHRKDNNSVTFFKTCSITNKEYSVTLTTSEYRLICSPDRPPIQNALPHFSVGQREFLMSGVTPAEFEKTFPPWE